MNAPRCTELDYIAFLLAAQRVFSCTEAARCQPLSDTAPAHDALTRLLTRAPLDTAALWDEVEPCVQKKQGVLVIDDTTLDKPYARHIDLVTRHWSGKHHRVVWGINLQTMVWTDGKTALPCDFRVLDKAAATKQQTFRAMLTESKARGFAPQCVLFDSWYSALDNLKHLRQLGFHWLTRLKHNRLVDADSTGNRAVSSIEIAPEGMVVHLKGYGFVRVFRTVSTDGHAEHYATDLLEMREAERAAFLAQAWQIESYHRSLKQYCGVERASVRSAVGQINHVLLSIRAFVRLEVHRVRTGVSHFEAKARLMREAVRSFLACPTLLNLPTA